MGLVTCCWRRRKREKREREREREREKRKGEKEREIERDGPVVGVGGSAVPRTPGATSESHSIYSAGLIEITLP